MQASLGHNLAGEQELQSTDVSSSSKSAFETSHQSNLEPSPDGATPAPPDDDDWQTVTYSRGKFKPTTFKSDISSTPDQDPPEPSERPRPRYTAYTSPSWIEYRETEEERKAKWAHERTVGLPFEGLKARIEAAETHASGSRSTYSVLASGPKTPGGVAHLDEEVGVICWHFDDRVLEDDETAPEGWETFKEDGATWMRKGCYWIIVDVSALGTVTEVPIYTNGDRGFKKVRRINQGNYFAVCPTGVEPCLIDRAESHNPLLQIDWTGINATKRL